MSNNCSLIIVLYGPYNNIQTNKQTNKIACQAVLEAAVEAVPSNQKMKRHVAPPSAGVKYEKAIDYTVPVVPISTPPTIRLALMRHVVVVKVEVDPNHAVDHLIRRRDVVVVG